MATPLDVLVRYVEALLTDFPVGASFNNYAFLGLFLPVALAGYWSIPRRRGKLVWLTLMSAVFYSMYDVRFTGLLFVAAVVDYWIARGMEPQVGQSRKAWLAGSITFNLALLGVFKYAVFARDTAQSLFDLVGASVELPGFQIVLPAGISFFTFKTMSYTIDVYRSEVHATRDLVKYCAFVGMFPELVAGPIVRYKTMDQQMDEVPHRLPPAFLTVGISLFCIGLAKKVLVADTIAFETGHLWSRPEALSAYEAWKAALGYTLQLYFDFSGYSDMAIGLASLLGFVFPVNFRAPYQALNPSEFWSRWHITLSSFLRDYLYIPLGGNRGPGWMVARNLVVVMLLGGLWHGAAWTFVLWGLYHGMLLVVHRSISSAWGAWHVGLQRGLTFLLVVVGWVMFRADSVEDAGRVYAAMFGAASWEFVWEPGVLAFGLVALGAVFLLRPTAEMKFRSSTGWWAAMGALFALSVVFIGNVISPFLYYQF